MMITSVMRRPRNVHAPQAAAILYGDWGTSKAYVIGLAFGIGGYSSFWLILAVSILIVLVGMNYITICKFSPTGGGVYASARRKSEVLGLIGGYFLIADYLITASISALSSFEYLGVAHPTYCAIVTILFIGLLNYFGPRNTGNIALVITLATVFVVFLLACVSIPYLGEAVRNIQPPQGGIAVNWQHFVGIIVALSGVEAIANTTGVMRLDPGSSEFEPSVHQTSKKAIFWVMLEVAIFTALFGLAANALPGLHFLGGEVIAQDGTPIRDSMLRYMGSYFVSKDGLGEELTTGFSYLIGGVFATLLLSAVNTAIHGMISLLFVMSRDGEAPDFFQKLNRFGVPYFPLLITACTAALILVFVHDIPSLADLYAVGFVGAIATNLGVNACDHTLPMSKGERMLMGSTFIIMAAIEITLFLDKQHARGFAFFVVMVGLMLRAFVMEQKQKAWAAKKIHPQHEHVSLDKEDEKAPLHFGAFLCPVRNVGKTLNFALQEAKLAEQPLYILFIREQKVITDQDKNRTWLDDKDACEIFDYIKESSHEMTLKFLYAISASPIDVIVEMAKRLHVSRVIMGKTRHNTMMQLLRGNIVKEIAEVLPSQIDLLVIS